MSEASARDLALTRQHLVEGELRCTEQRLRIAQLAGSGGETASAEVLLAVFEGSLAQMRAHLQILQAERDAR